MTIVDVTEDSLLNGRIRVRQPARGYRVNNDTLLLAAAVEAASGMRLMEAGCGVGAALLAVAARAEGTTFVGVELNEDMASLARENLALNAMSSRAEILAGDALAKDAAYGVFDGVFVNPPYFSEAHGRPPSEARRFARLTAVPVDAWVAALADRLRGGGALTLIHRSERLPEILAALDGRLGGVEVFPVRGRPGEPASRVLVRARKGSRAKLRLLPGIDEHDDSGSVLSSILKGILRDGAPLTWGD